MNPSGDSPNRSNDSDNRTGTQISPSGTLVVESPLTQSQHTSPEQRLANDIKKLKEKVRTASIGDLRLYLNNILENSDIEYNQKQLAFIRGQGPLFVNETSEMASSSEGTLAGLGFEHEDIETAPVTPIAVIEMIDNINTVAGNIDNIDDLVIEESQLKMILQDLSTKLKGLLGDDSISPEHLEAVLDPEKINVDVSDADSTVVSDVSKGTTMILQHEPLTGTRSNTLVESSDRNKQIQNIIRGMLKNDFKRQHHMQTGKDKKLRDQVERLTGTDPQFINVWGGTTGTILERSKWAKGRCCYLCGGPLVSNGITSPEMEHKLASLEFYTKVHNINEKYPDLLEEWQTYVSGNLASIKKLYNHINCNKPSKWIRSPMNDKPVDNIKELINTTLKPFITSMSRGSYPDLDGFIALLKVYLMEFAYAHHTCNQIKENDNLNTPAIRTAYLKKINVAKQQKRFSSKPLLVEGKLVAEHDSIIDDATNNQIIAGHMGLINDYIGEYAVSLATDEERDNYKTPKQLKEYCLKKMMVQSIKSTVNFIIKAKNKEKAVKKHIMNMAKQESNATALAAKSAEYRPLLDTLNELKRITDEHETLRGRQKALFISGTQGRKKGEDSSYNIAIGHIENIEDDGQIKKATLGQDAKVLKGMLPSIMYENLRNSELGSNLCRIYHSRMNPELNDEMRVHFADKECKPVFKKTRSGEADDVNISSNIGQSLVSNVPNTLLDQQQDDDISSIIVDTTGHIDECLRMLEQMYNDLELISEGKLDHKIATNLISEMLELLPQMKTRTFENTFNLTNLPRPLYQSNADEITRIVNHMSELSGNINTTTLRAMELRNTLTESELFPIARGDIDRMEVSDLHATLDRVLEIQNQIGQNMQIAHEFLVTNEEEQNMIQKINRDNLDLSKWIDAIIPNIEGNLKKMTSNDMDTNGGGGTRKRGRRHAHARTQRKPVQRKSKRTQRNAAQRKRNNMTRTRRRR